MNWNMSSVRRLLVAIGVFSVLVVLSACSNNSGGNKLPQQYQMATPAISPATSNQTACSVSIGITDATAGANIYYTIDGSTPTTASSAYSKAFTINCPSNTGSLTVKAFAPAISSNYTDSDVASVTYTFSVVMPKMATPSITPATGNIFSGASVSIADTTAGATIYYTTDGSVPTTASKKYTASFTLASSGTVKAYAPAMTGYLDSDVASATYVLVQNPTVTVGTMSSAVLLNVKNVALPVTTSNCLSMTYSITPAFPVPPISGGVMGTITFNNTNPCQPLFSPGSTMPNPSAQYAVTFTAVGATGTTSATSSELVINLTTPAPVLDTTSPATPATIPAGDGDVVLTFNGIGCTFVSYNGVAWGGADYWGGTQVGGGTPADAENGIRAGFTDCNHVTDDISYHGFSAGDQVWMYIFNPAPVGGLSSKVVFPVVATTTTSSVATTASGSVATLQSTVVDAQGSIKAMAMPSARVTPSARQITFGSNTIAAGDIHQLTACGASMENFCGLGKTSLTTFSANGTVTSTSNLPEDANFAIANNNGIYVFSTTGNLYSLDAKTGAFTLMNSFKSTGVKTAAISNNTIVALTSDSQLLLYDVANQITLGSYTVPTDSNNIAFTSDNYILVGILGSKTLTVLDRFGNSNSYTLPATLLTLTNSVNGEALASLNDGTVVAVDSYGSTALRARANSAEDLHAGFRITGRTLVLAPADRTGLRHLMRLIVDVQ